MLSSEKSKILEAAQQFTIRGQIQKAIEEWKKLLTSTPNDANIYNTIGDLCLKNQTASNSSADAISYYENAGRIFEASGFALKAIAVYKKILKIDPSRKEIYLRLGDLNRERGLIGNAREDYLYAAKLYSQEGLAKEALEVYRKIADIDPSNLAIRKKIADIFYKEGLKKEAIEEYIKVAGAHLKSGEIDEAENLYKLILTLEPNNISAIVQVGRFHLENGHIDEAIGYGKKSFELSPDSLEVLSLLVDAYNKARRYNEAEELVTRILELNPRQLSYRDTLASILLNKGETQRAISEYLALSREYFSHRDFDRALSFAEKVAKISPDMIAAHEMLFEIYTNSSRKEETVGKGLFLAKHFDESGNVERAREYYLKILEEDPYNVEAKDGLSIISDTGVPDGADLSGVEKMEGAVDVAGQLASAEVYIKYGLMEKAIAELQNIVSQRDPNNEEAHIRLKDIYRAVGEQDKAIEECLTLLRIYESSGEQEKIEIVLQEAFDIKPEDRKVREYKDRLIGPPKANLNEMFEEARFYAQQGMIEEAIDIYEKVLGMDPGNDEALSQIATLKKTSSEVRIPEVEIIQPADEPSVSFFDLGEALKKEVVEVPQKAPAPAEGPLPKSFEEIFQEFHEGIQAQLSIEDYETHYNLGIAYKEMGLFQEAIEEFNLCTAGTTRFLDASYMIALCHKELGKYQQAIEALKTAVRSQQYNDQRHLGIKYELGVLLEMVGKREDALRVFSQIHDTDATYRDVSEKVLNLQKER